MLGIGREPFGPGRIQNRLQRVALKLHRPLDMLMHIGDSLHAAFTPLYAAVCIGSSVFIEKQKLSASWPFSGFSRDMPFWPAALSKMPLLTAISSYIRLTKLLLYLYSSMSLFSYHLIPFPTFYTSRPLHVDATLLFSAACSTPSLGWIATREYS